MAQRFDARIALVTGAGRGIGAKIALELAARGALVIATDLDAKSTIETVREIEAQGGRALNFALDVRKPEDFAEVLREVRGRHGEVDILVNNAGVLVAGSIEQGRGEQDRLQVEVNLLGVLNGMRAVLPTMRQRGFGHIVNVASIAGRIPLPHAALYSATKHGVVALTDAARAEAGSCGVRFSMVLPSYVATDMIHGVRRPLFPPVLAPAAVAAAVVAVLSSGARHRYVPRYLWLFAVLQLVMPILLLEWVSRKLRIVDSFAQVR